MRSPSKLTVVLKISLLVHLAWFVIVPPLASAGISLQFGNLHNPYFPDRLPTAEANLGYNYVFAPPPNRLFGLQGDIVPVVFTVRSTEAHRISIDIKVEEDKKVGSADILTPHIVVYRARDVRVEGNSNGVCTCPAGQLPQIDRQKGVLTCVGEATILDSRIPAGCPSLVQREKISKTLVRTAPFVIKDALEPFSDIWFSLDANTTELFIAEIKIDDNLPKGDREVRVSVAQNGGSAVSIKIPLRVVSLRLEGFPAADLSYWLSEDPRDLVERPDGISLGSHWGGEWWSEEHWRNLERAAVLQGRFGVTHGLVPLFVRNPFGVDARSLVSVKCITGSNDRPSDYTRVGTHQPLSPFNSAVAKWVYEFDFTRFHRFIEILKRTGVKRFEGAHLMASGGQLPLQLECDLYRAKEDTEPYAKGFRFLPRAGMVTEEFDQRNARVKLFLGRFLPVFMQDLAVELEKAGIAEQWFQHLIDENLPNDEAIASYGRLASIVKGTLRQSWTMDAINQYVAPRYRGLIDLPVLHLGLLYDDQMRQRDVRQEILKAFSGRKYFYNTALREGGPNRFLDTNPLDNRVYGWLALELGYEGILYWAANSYRYPVGGNVLQFDRSEDWSPYQQTIGPLPHGYVHPGHSPGGNWHLYPTKSGLIGSLRALRLRDGLLDHWLYKRAEIQCGISKKPQCYGNLISQRERITSDEMNVGDFSRNPADYDIARAYLIDFLEPQPSIVCPIYK